MRIRHDADYSHYWPIHEHYEPTLAERLHTLRYGKEAYDSGQHFVEGAITYETVREPKIPPLGLHPAMFHTPIEHKTGLNLKPSEREELDIGRQRSLTSP